MIPLNPAGPRAGIVISADRWQDAVGLAKAAVSDQRKADEADKTALHTKWRLGQVLHDLKRDVPHGQWEKECKARGLSSQLVSEAMRFALIPLYKVEELGTQAAVLRLVHEREAEEAKASGQIPDPPGFDEPEGTGEGAKPTVAAGAAASPKPTAPSPAAASSSEQQTLPGMGKPEDPAAVQRRLDAKHRRDAREAAKKVAEVQETIGLILRCGGPVANEIERLLRTAGHRLDRVDPPEAAAGFEGKQEPVRWVWRELETAERRLEQAAGKDQ